MCTQGNKVINTENNSVHMLYGMLEMSTAVRVVYCIRKEGF